MTDNQLFGLIAVVVPAIFVWITWEVMRVVSRESALWRELARRRLEVEAQRPITLDDNPNGPTESALHVPPGFRYPGDDDDEETEEDEE